MCYGRCRSHLLSRILHFFSRRRLLQKAMVSENINDWPWHAQAKPKHLSQGSCTQSSGNIMEHREEISLKSEYQEICLRLCLSMTGAVHLWDLNSLNKTWTIITPVDFATDEGNLMELYHWRTINKWHQLKGGELVFSREWTLELEIGAQMQWSILEIFLFRPYWNNSVHCIYMLFYL